MATYTSMVAKVRNTLRDSEAVFITDAMIGEWINEAYLDLVARLSLLRKAATGTTSATGTITIPSDFISVTRLKIDSGAGDGTYVEPLWTSDDIFMSYTTADVDPHINIYRIFNGTLETWPQLESLAYTLEYVYKPTAISGSTEPSIPEETHIRLVNYARAHAKYIEGEMPEGDRYMALYTEGLPTAPTGIKRERPGPFTMVPEPTYWEAEWE